MLGLTHGLCQQVLAGALQDNARATIVGETTFGKGLIQTIVELSDGSAVVVTVARYQVLTNDGSLNVFLLAADLYPQEKGHPDLPICTQHECISACHLWQVHLGGYMSLSMP